MKIIAVAGARPNFMKIAPLMRVLRSTPGIESLLVHTGQHYDEKMSQLFFDELQIPKPDLNLEVGSGSVSASMAKILLSFEPVLLREQPDLVIVVGDVTSTIACTFAAVQMQIPVAHVEAGLRSFDREMPEEINRILTDSVSDFLFVTEESAIENLRDEGIPDSKIFFCRQCDDRHFAGEQGEIRSVDNSEPTRIAAGRLCAADTASALEC